MLNFPQPPKDYSSVFLKETDKPLPEKINPHTRYAFFSTIAKGGKSLIKSCKDLHLSRFICYKTLRPEFAKDEVEQIRLIREARVTAMLQHPNTVPTYELGRDGRGNPYFTMKLVHGYTLREIFDYRERYDLMQLMEVITQVGQALQYAHTHGVAHRDIKPENILVGPYGEVLVLDWGLAKVWDPESSKPDTNLENGSSKLDTDHEPTQRKDIEAIRDITITSHEKPQGTLSYMSPEQLQNDPSIAYHTDIYSLGAVIFEALCGRPPFEGDKLYELTEKVSNELPPMPSEITSQRIPESLERACLKCLEKKPENRFATVSELLRVLQSDWRAELSWI